MSQNNEEVYDENYSPDIQKQSKLETEINNNNTQSDTILNNLLTNPESQLEQMNEMNDKIVNSDHENSLILPAIINNQKIISQAQTTGELNGNPTKSQFEFQHVTNSIQKYDSINKIKNRNMKPKVSSSFHTPSYLNIYHFPVIQTKDSGLTKKGSSTNRNKKNFATKENEEEEFKHKGSIKFDNEQIFEDNFESELITKQFSVQNQPQVSTRKQSLQDYTQHSRSHSEQIQGTEQKNYNQSQVSILGLSSLAQAKKLKDQKETNLKQLHTRIAQLQAEEEKALKMIEETRSKARKMLEFRIEQQQLEKKREEIKITEDMKARHQVLTILQEQKLAQQKIQDLLETRKNDAKQIKKCSIKAQKQIQRIHEKYLLEAQEKRFEMQILSEASKLRNSQFQSNRQEMFKKEKQDNILLEERRILKKEKQAAKLELLQAEVLKRLRNTQVKHQSAIEEIQTLLQTKDYSKIVFIGNEFKIIEDFNETQNQYFTEDNPINFNATLRDQQSSRGGLQSRENTNFDASPVTMTQKINNNI